MVATPPLQVLLLRHPGDKKDVQPITDAIVRAFQGSTDPSGYLAAGAGVGITPELFDEAPAVAVADKLDAACHTLVIVLVGRALLDEGTPALRRWLRDCWAHVDQSRDRHRMLVFPLEETMGRE